MSKRPKTITIGQKLAARQLFLTRITDGDDERTCVILMNISKQKKDKKQKFKQDFLSHNLDIVYFT